MLALAFKLKSRKFNRDFIFRCVFKRGKKTCLHESGLQVEVQLEVFSFTSLSIRLRFRLGHRRDPQSGSDSAESEC